jgi:hypothetical protein
MSDEMAEAHARLCEWMVTVRGHVVTASALRAHGWVERAEDLAVEHDGRAVFAHRGDAEEFAAWMGRTFREPQDRAVVVESNGGGA